MWVWNAHRVRENPRSISGVGVRNIEEVPPSCFESKREVSAGVVAALGRRERMGWLSVAAGRSARAFRVRDTKRQWTTVVVDPRVMCVRRYSERAALKSVFRSLCGGEAARATRSFWGGDSAIADVAAYEEVGVCLCERDADH